MEFVGRASGAEHDTDSVGARRPRPRHANAVASRTPMPPALAPLPIAAVLADLIAALRTHPCAVLRAPTGA